MATSKEPVEMPVRSAGGGKPAATNFAVDIHPGTPLQQQLHNVFENLTKDELFQDDLKVTDEASFMSYIQSSASSAIEPPGPRDLNHPISNYFISSSHNTYLSGNQLYGEASTEAYTNVLRRGCRCLEIDVWDGEDAETDASSADEDHSHDGATRQRSNSKTSRWAKLKKKAENRAIEIRRTPSPSHHHRHLSSEAATHDAELSAASPPNDPGHLSTTPSATQTEKIEPRVLHGFTLTQSVPFRAVCIAIRNSAFIATNLPIIVSLEVHASLEQQGIMVDIMRETWGDHLVDITSLDENHISNLPSPGSLLNKILIKVKWSTNTQSDESNNPLDHVATTASSGSTETHSQNPSGAQKKASKVLAALSELGVYTRAYTFKHFDQPEASIPTHVFSLSEGKVHDMHSSPEHGPALFNHNKDFLMRVFPKGTRIRSTNVDPTFHWRQGAQMVALNWQKLDRGMMLNEGMFAGYEGWVLKPESYRGSKLELTSNDQTHDSTNPASTPRKHLLDLKIQLLSAQDLPLPIGKDSSHRPKMKPYVTIQLHTDIHGPPGQGKPSRSAKLQSDPYGEEDEEKKSKRRSKTNRTDTPNFGGETLTWSSIPDVVEQLSFVRYVIFQVSFSVKCSNFVRYLGGYEVLLLYDSSQAGCVINLVLGHSPPFQLHHCVNATTPNMSEHLVKR